MTYKRIGELVVQEVKTITNKVLREKKDKVIQDFLDANMADEAARTQREYDGGSCPICGKAYISVHIKNGSEKDDVVFADFDMYKPECTCEETENETKEKNKMISESLINAGVPEAYAGVSFGSWDYGAKPETNAAMKSVFDWSQAKQYKEEGLILYGACGTGKTRCAVSVLRMAIMDGMLVRFETMAGIIGRFFDKESGRRYMESLLAKDVVLFDDLDKIMTESEAVRDQIFSVMNGIINRKKAVIGTTNLMGPKDFLDKFGQAVTSRLSGGCFMLEFPGDDYRIRRALMEKESQKKKT
jgi:DNA replication protein DnaC